MTWRVGTHGAEVGVDRVEGPLKGHHHYSFAVRLDRGSPLAGDFTWLKLREPRPGIFWYDMRFFPSEDLLLEWVQGRLPHVPRVRRLRVLDGELTFAEFIEGVTLDRLPAAAERVPERVLEQVEELFAALAAVDPEPLLAGGQPSCDCADRESGSGARGATGFLPELLHFAVTHIYLPHRPRLGGLFEDLGVSDRTLTGLPYRVPDLTPRAPRLLHGDLHRKNLVVDRWGSLWAIDWELALIGDPLYDLATHLHLMGYRPDQEGDVVRRWCRAVGPDAARGLEADLPHYRDFKRVQSVCTDVIRSAARLAEQPGSASLRRVAAVVHRALLAAREPLDMEKVPPLVAVEAAFEAWLRSKGSETLNDSPHGI
ncbi:phosphotransferase family protein [Actinacidiphila bryophytorum]|uniref:Phosphotransferase enzyme family protein n=1 Tax=Actinacidiphila bryophytorum TaxID=1436133 RepID=A0A9W4GYH2_9ACTN|nr:aminoglycoside phosphotransferase family protein [Actinacidiphila bryophytorum]MBM9438946.1 aminoglycoside phosphotransferase family protein [Actinacidiphila bryophytorum]MBN6547738.1 aminoglycoside phosphotransferase family protein [Actinacidiphila bryophytorum]CAG7616397.1 Phosphotransferase enzyme family protein [Actinacidiphila bryophytorum]